MLALRSDRSWLLNQTAELLLGCQLVSQNGTHIFTPDAVQGYGAQWTRDFAYAVQNTPATLWKPAELRSAVRWTFGGQRADGCMPDRVRKDGVAVMAPGPVSAPMADHAWDNGPFAALLLAAATQKFPGDAESRTLFCELEPQAQRALAFVRQPAPSPLVWNDPQAPNCTYGFTDTIAKSGRLLFTSLLLVDASQQMASLAAALGCGDAAAYAKQARDASAGLDQLYAGETGLWLAADGANALPDVWGTAYLVSLNASTAERRARAVEYLVAQRAAIFRWGQVRHLPAPLTWQKCFGTCPANGTYQNGAYWATPLHYVARALVGAGRRDFVTSLLTETMDYFRGRSPGTPWSGINEAVNPQGGWHGVDAYVASATNVLRALDEVLS
jgi:hypothetical protein